MAKMRKEEKQCALETLSKRYDITKNGNLLRCEFQINRTGLTLERKFGKQQLQCFSLEDWCHLRANWAKYLTHVWLRMYAGPKNKRNPSRTPLSEHWQKIQEMSKLVSEVDSATDGSDNHMEMGAIAQRISEANKLSHEFKSTIGAICKIAYKLNNSLSTPQEVDKMLGLLRPQLLQRNFCNL
jgi:hypothetical protein